jgi:hypothetical protein
VRLRAEMRAHHRRLLLAITGSGLLVSAAVVLTFGGGLNIWAGAVAWLLGGAGLALITVSWPRRSA